MPTFHGWPPRSSLSFFSRGVPIRQQRDEGRLDLSDTIMGYWPHAQRTVEMRLRTLSSKWQFWGEDELAVTEDNIRYDLGFDGYRVIIKRLSGEGEPCSTDMRWSLIVRFMT